MAKKTIKTVKKLSIKEKPLHIPLSFEEIIKKAVNTPIKNSKINKR
jgi:hypothetical protein